MIGNTGYEENVGSVGYVIPLLFEMFVYGLLLLGAILNNQIAVLVHVILLVILLVVKGTVLYLVVLTWLLVCTAHDWDWNCTSWLFLIMVIMLVNIALHIYFWIVSLSFYQELNGGGRIFDFLNLKF